MAMSAKQISSISHTVSDCGFFIFIFSPAYASMEGGFISQLLFMGFFILVFHFQLFMVVLPYHEPPPNYNLISN